MLASFVLAAEKSLKVLPDPDEFLWGTIFFLILAIAMWILVFPKVKETLEKRRRAIQGQLEEAERAKREADTLLDQYRQQLADARNEAARIIDEGKKTAESLRRDLVAKAEEEAQQIVARARQEVSGERDRALAELRGTLGDLSIQLAQRVIEKELSSPEAQKQLVERAIDELARGNGANN
jgi:F-type H+-transporting ATPase subunit b